MKFAYETSVLLETLVRPSFTGICAKQHHSPKYIVGCCSCGEKDGHCRWGRFFTFRWSVQSPWRMIRSAVTSCFALVYVKWSQHPQACIHSIDCYHRLSREARATESNLDHTLAWFIDTAARGCLDLMLAMPYLSWASVSFHCCWDTYCR